MKPSTKHLQEEEHGGQWHPVGLMINIVLVTIIAGLSVILVVVLGLFFINYKLDDNDKYSNAKEHKRDYDVMLKAQEECEMNKARLSAYVKYNQGKGQDVPPEFLIETKCSETVINPNNNSTGDH